MPSSLLGRTSAFTFALSMNNSLLWAYVEVVALLWGFVFALSRSPVTSFSWTAAARAAGTMVGAAAPYLALRYYQHGGDVLVANGLTRVILLLVCAHEVRLAPTRPRPTASWAYLWGVVTLFNTHTSFAVPDRYGHLLTLIGSVIIVGVAALQKLRRSSPMVAVWWCAAITLGLVVGITLAEGLS